MSTRQSTRAAMRKARQDKRMALMTPEEREMGRKHPAGLVAYITFGKRTLEQCIAEVAARRPNKQAMRDQRARSR